MFKPTDLGLPEHFKAWRPHQYDSARLIATTKKRVVMLDAPTGTGKSGIYMAARALLGDLRAAIVTSTTALQDQISQEFPYVSDLRGQEHYTCHELVSHSCRIGMQNSCGLSNSRSCPWSAARRTMQRSDDVCTNYAAWLNYGRAMGFYDYVVFDESHDAEEWLTRSFGVRIPFRYAYGVLLSDPPTEPSIDVWRAWAREMMPRALEACAFWKMRAVSNGGSEVMRQFKRATEGKIALTTLIAGNEQWACDLHEDAVEFAPIDVRKYKETLFRNFERIVLSSATNSIATVSALGIEQDEVERVVVPAPFLKSNYRIVFAPVLKKEKDRQVSVGWNYGSSDEDIKSILERLVTIISQRTDRRGIVHSVSYSRAQLIAEVVRDVLGGRVYVYSPSRDTLQESITAFREGPSNAVLISPALIAGHNFEHDMCRYQILPKLPWPDTRSALMRERLKIDPNYAARLCMQKTVQALGRGNRSIDDWCENFIIDGSFEWFWQRYKKSLSPDWFAQYVQIDFGNRWKTAKRIVS